MSSLAPFYSRPTRSHYWTTVYFPVSNFVPHIIHFFSPGNQSGLLQNESQLKTVHWISVVLGIESEILKCLVRLARAYLTNNVFSCTSSDFLSYSHTLYFLLRSGSFLTSGFLQLLCSLILGLSFASSALACHLLLKNNFIYSFNKNSVTVFKVVKFLPHPIIFYLLRTFFCLAPDTSCLAKYFAHSSHSELAEKNESLWRLTEPNAKGINILISGNIEVGVVFLHIVPKFSVMSFYKLENKPF